MRASISVTRSSRAAVTRAPTSASCASQKSRPSASASSLRMARSSALRWASACAYARRVAARASSLAYGALPEPVRALARQCVLDYLGVALAGAGDPLVDILLNEMGEAGGAPQKQADARCERDRGAEIDEYLACGHTLGYRLPDRGEIALGQTLDSECDHDRRKDRMARACDPHRPCSGAIPVHSIRLLHAQTPA